MRIEEIENILDEFDFSYVNKAMALLEWEWCSSAGVPTVGELRRVARSLLEEAYNQPPAPFYMVGTGGFEAIRTMETGGLNKYLSLKFVLSEWNNYD